MPLSVQSKPKLAIILSRFPFPLEKGDKLRAYYQIKELSKKYSISLFALTEKEISPEHKSQLEKYCTTIHVYRLRKWMIAFQLLLSFFRDRPFQVGYFYDPRIHSEIRKELNNLKPDHIFCQLIRATEYVKDYHYCPKTLDYMDALSKGIERRIEKAPIYSRWLFRSEARRLSNYERQIFAYFERKIIISEQDRDLILHPDRISIVCVPNGIDRSFFDFSSTKANYDLVFVGNMSYAPNVEAVEYIADLLNDLPDYTCLIAGANPSNAVKKLAAKQPRLHLKGWVEDIRTAYCDGKIFIAPMMIGTGMQNKLLEAMALGIPCITTSLANNAIKATNGKSILVADTRQEFIDAIQLLHSNSELYKTIASGGNKFVEQEYSWEKSTNMIVSSELTQ